MCRGAQPYSSVVWESLLCLDYLGTFIELSGWGQALRECRHILWHEYIESWIFEESLFLSFAFIVKLKETDHSNNNCIVQEIT